MSLRRGIVPFAGAALVLWLTAGAHRGYAVGGLDRAGLTRFLCEALRTDNVPVAIARMDQGFFATTAPVAMQESVVPGERWSTHTFVRGFFGNEIRYSFNESRTGGGERTGFSLSISQDAPQGVWFQQLPESRAWLEAAGLVTRRKNSGVEGYAPASRLALSDPTAKDPSGEFGFTVYVDVFNTVEVNWSRPDQMKHGEGFCASGD